MATEIKLPDLGEGVTEGELVRWLVKEGDSIVHDQPMVELMTDKATVEVPCSRAGKVLKLVAKEGQMVKVGGVLLLMDDGGATATVTTAAKAPAAPASRPAPTSSPSVAAPVAVAQASAPTTGIFPPPAGEKVLASPSTRRLAREVGVDLNRLAGSGPAGRVTREDIERAKSGVGAMAAGVPAPSIGSAPTPFKAPPFISTNAALEERKPLRGIRKKIAENLVRSKQIIPHFTHLDELDVTELVQWRAKLKEASATRGVKLTYLPIIMKAVALTCREFPQMNCSIDDAAGEIVYKNYFNVGFAADTPEGLLVPVVKGVETKSILEIAQDIQTLAEKARMGKLAPDDMKGGTITVTNIGSIGGIGATPIINHPEVAIIGVFKIQKKPVVINDEIKIRETMVMSATCDHRIVDGAAAARFMNKLMERLQNPQSMLLEMI